MDLLNRARRGKRNIVSRPLHQHKTARNLTLIVVPAVASRAANRYGYDIDQSHPSNFRRWQNLTDTHPPLKN